MTQVINSSKMVAIKMDLLMTDIHRIWSSVHSPYTQQKRTLSDARSVLYSNPKRALKLMRRAREDMISESLAAQEYNRYRLMLPQIDDDEVVSLDSKYQDALSNGKYAAARKYAQKLSSCDAVRSSAHSINVHLESQNDTSLTYVLENSSNEDIIVKRFAVCMDQKQLMSDCVYPFPIRRCTQTRVRFDRAGLSGASTQVSLEYSENGMIKTVFTESHLDTEA